MLRRPVPRHQRPGVAAERGVRPWAGSWLLWALLLIALVGSRALGAARDTARPAPAEPSHLRVHFIDVGQGDATLLETPNGKRLLIDAGPPEEADRLLAYLRAQGVSRLDAVLISHPHADHIGGLLAVLTAIPAAVVYDPGIPHATTTYRRLLEWIDRHDLPYRLARRGTALALDPAVSMTFLHPAGEPEGDVNDASAVLSVRFQQVSLLFTGDIGADVEAQLLARGEPLASDVLKVAHHGSRTSSSAAFLAAVSPRYAVIFAGARNPYGHPHPEVLARLQRAGARVFVTARDGTLLLESDGRRLSLTPARTAPATASARR